MTKKKFFRLSVIRHLAVMAISFGLVGVLVFCTLNISFLNPIETAFEDFSITDMYYQMHNNVGEARKSNLVTIVDMTDLNARRDLAKTIEEIESHNPAVLGIDIVFEGLKEDTIGDNMVMDVAEKYENMVYSYKLLNYINGQYTEEVHSFFTPFIPVTEGFTNFERKLYGGIKREVTIGQASQGDVKPSFALTVANMYAGQETMPLEDKQMIINFIPTDFNTISYNEVSQYPELIDGRIVLLGATKDEYDMHYTPLGKKPGVELIAYSVETILRQKEVRTASWWEFALLSILIVLLTEVLVSWYKDVMRKLPKGLCKLILSSSMVITILVFVLMLVYFMGAYWAFYVCNFSVNLGWAFSAMACIDLSQQFYDIFTKEE